MLLACSRCHRQYDVGTCPEGARVRCSCGTLNTVAKPRARTVEMLHCSNCGGRLESASTCSYCSATVKLADRGLGPACPECFVTTFAGARHCQACGVRIAPETVLRALAERACPRCRSELTEFETQDERYVSCTACGGLWLEEAAFQRVAERHDDDLAARIRASAGTAAAARPAETIRYLPCPHCGELMNRRNFAECSGIILDWCRGHGWWFDAQELERVVAFLRSGGLERARSVQHEKRVMELRREADRARMAQPVPGHVPDVGGGDLIEALAVLLGRVLGRF